MNPSSPCGRQARIRKIRVSRPSRGEPLYVVACEEDPTRCPAAARGMPAQPGRGCCAQQSRSASLRDFERLDLADLAWLGDSF